MGKSYHLSLGNLYSVAQITITTKDFQATVEDLNFYLSCPYSDAFAAILVYLHLTKSGTRSCKEPPVEWDQTQLLASFVGLPQLLISTIKRKILKTYLQNTCIKSVCKIIMKVPDFCFNPSIVCVSGVINITFV